MLSMKICKNMSQITKQSSSAMLVHKNQTQPITATEFTNPKYKQNGTKYTAYKNIKKKVTTFKVCRLLKCPHYR